MKIREIKRFRSAKNGIINDKFLITVTGRTAMVYDAESLEELASFGGMTHAYKLAFRPGRNDFAVKSYDNNLFFYNLDTMQLVRKVHTYNFTVTQDYGFCYSFDGGAFYDIVSTKDLLTYLVRYNADTLDKAAAWFIEDNYVLYDMQYVPKAGQYVLHGYERLNNRTCNQDLLLWFDEASGSFSRIDLKCNAMKMSRMRYSPQQDALMAADALKCGLALHEMDGTIRDTLLLRTESTKTCALRESLGNKLADALQLMANTLQHTAAEADQIIVSSEEMLNDAVFTENGKYVIAAKYNGVWIFEFGTMDCLCHIPIKYVTDVIIQGNKLFAFTWSGGFAYEVEW